MVLVRFIIVFLAIVESVNVSIYLIHLLSSFAEKFVSSDVYLELWNLGFIWREKFSVFNRGRYTIFGLSYRDIRKVKGSRNRYSSVYIL